MANSGTVGAVSPFGAENETGDTIVAVDPTAAFLQDVAPLLVAGLVIVAFLAFQFGRWYLAGRSFAGDVTTVREPKATPVAAPPASDGDHAAGPEQRPWRA